MARAEESTGLEGPIHGESDMMVRMAIAGAFLLVLALATRNVWFHVEPSERRGRDVAVKVREIVAGEDSSQAVNGESAPGTTQASVEPATAETDAETRRADEEAARMEVQQLLAEGEELAREVEAVPVSTVLRGRVVAQEDGSPMPGVTLRRSGVELGITDEDGWFELEPSASHALPVAFEAAGRSITFAFLSGPAPVSAAAEGEAAEIVVELRRSAVLEGQLADAGRQPVGRARVVITARAEDLECHLGGEAKLEGPRFHAPDPRWEATTDDQGRIHVEGLPSGVPLVLTFWNADAEPRLSASPVPGVASVVRDEEGLPLGCLLAPARPVVLRAEEVRDLEWLLGEAETTRRIASAAPPAPLSETPADQVAAVVPSTLGFVAPEATEAPHSREAVAEVLLETPFVSVPDAESTSQAVNFQAPAPEGLDALAQAPERALLSGRVVDESGEPQAGLLVVARSEEWPE
jgi:hypothetical protein